LTVTIADPGKPAGIDRFVSFVGWQRAGMVAAMIKRTAGTFAPEIVTA
jgi:hypothetical protein